MHPIDMSYPMTEKELMGYSEQILNPINQSLYL